VPNQGGCKRVKLHYKMDTQKQPSWLVTTAHERRLSRLQPISNSHALLTEFFYR